MILVLVEGGPRNERRRLNLLVLGELNSRRESEQSKYNNTVCVSTDHTVPICK